MSQAFLHVQYYRKRRTAHVHDILIPCSVSTLEGNYGKFSTCFIHFLDCFAYSTIILSNLLTVIKAIFGSKQMNALQRHAQTSPPELKILFLFFSIVPFFRIF